ASAHGLGHLMAPYGDDEALPGLAAPAIPLSAMGVKRWQHDLWTKIIEAALAGKPNQVPMDWHPAFQKSAVSRYGATSPKLLAWMDKWNEGRNYKDQVRPFGFLVSLMPRTGPFAEMADQDVADPSKRGRPNKQSKPRPIAPFDRDHDRAAQQAFDRVTGESVGRRALKNYAEALAQFHLSAEDKFENGDFFDVGATGRRQIFATIIKLIGKEANRVDTSGLDEPANRVRMGLRLHDL
ncbi:MAG: hypothetical protein K1X51_12835, partial [Rhodospirillaceae bacterium]|nr:hypothetical protein [Rhodospirillaceae bacterium]